MSQETKHVSIKAMIACAMLVSVAFSPVLVGAQPSFTSATETPSDVSGTLHVQQGANESNTTFNQLNVSQVQLQNVTIQNATFRNISGVNVTTEHGTRNVTLSNKSFLSMTVNGTLANVTFEDVIIRNEQLRNNIINKANTSTPEQGPSVDELTLQNITIDGLVVNETMVKGMSIENVTLKDQGGYKPATSVVSRPPAIAIGNATASNVTITSAVILTEPGAEGIETTTEEARTTTNRTETVTENVETTTAGAETTTEGSENA